MNVKFAVILANHISASFLWIFPLKSPQNKALMVVCVGDGIKLPLSVQMVTGGNQQELNLYVNRQLRSWLHIAPS